MWHFRLWLRAEWDRVLGTTLIAVGAVLLVITYQGIAHGKFVADQLARLASGGLGGLFLLAVGAMLRLQADLHDEWRKLDRIEAALRDETLAEADAVLDAPRSATRRSPDASPAAVALPAGVSAAGLAVDWKALRLRRPLGLAAGGLTLAAAVTSAGFHHSANSRSVDGAFGGLAIGVVGLAVAAVVVAGYTMALRHRIGGRKVALLAGWLVPAATETAAPAVVLVAEAQSHFHVPGCPMLGSARTTAVARAEVGGLAPCAICGAH